MFHRGSSRPSRGKRIAAAVAVVAVGVSGLFAFNAVQANAAPSDMCERTDTIDNVLFSDGRTYGVYRFECSTDTNTAVLDLNPSEPNARQNAAKIVTYKADSEVNDGESEHDFYCQVEGHSTNAVSGNSWWAATRTNNGSYGMVPVGHITQENGNGGRARNLPDCREESLESGVGDYVIPDDNRNGGAATFTRASNSSRSSNATEESATTNTNNNSNLNCSNPRNFNGNEYCPKTLRVFQPVEVATNSEGGLEKRNVSTAPTYTKTNQSGYRGHDGRIAPGSYEFVCQERGGNNPITYNRNTNTNQAHTGNWWARLVPSNNASGWVPVTYLSVGNSENGVPGLTICKSNSANT